MFVGNFISYTKSDSYEIVNVVTNFYGQPLSVKCYFWLALVVEWLEQRQMWTIFIELP